MSGKVSMCLLNPSLVLNKQPTMYHAPKPVVKAVAPKPVVKAVAPKPVVKAVAPKPVVKAVAPKPVVKAVAPKPVDNSKSTLNKDTKNKMNIAGLRNAKPCGRCGGAR